MDLKSLNERERIKSALEDARRDKLIQNFQLKTQYSFGMNR